jgi:hypothetical protein
MPKIGPSSKGSVNFFYNPFYNQLVWQKLYDFLFTWKKEGTQDFEKQ